MSSKKEFDPKKINSVANAIQIISVIGGIIGIIAGIILIKNPIGIPIIIASIVSAIFIYGFGEIIQLLEDIKNK